MKRLTSNNEGLWKGVFSILLGLIMVVWPSLTTGTIVMVLGIGLLVLGSALFLNYLLRKKKGFNPSTPLGAIIYLLLGLSMVLMPQLFVNILMVVFGIVLVIGGLDQIFVLAMGHRAGFRIPVLFYAAPILVLLIGLYIMFSPAISARTFIMLFGVTAIVYGIIVLYNTHVLKQAAKTITVIDVTNE